MPNKYRDITEQRFGKLVAIKKTTFKNGSTYWLFRCDCGNEKELRMTNVMYGGSKSCGCIRKNYVYPKKSLGMSKTRFYNIYKGMKQRCYDINSDAFSSYGGRGIIICERWHNFTNFYNDMFKKYEEHATIHGTKNTSIDRIDVNGSYSPENCRWATMKVQANNKNKSELVKYVEDFSKQTNMRKELVRSRLLLGWSEEEIKNGRRNIFNQRISAWRELVEFYWKNSGKLDERERDILHARYINLPAKTLKEVGKSFNITRERVRQLEERAIAKLMEI